MRRLSVLVADDDPMIREVLRDVLEAQPDLEVVAVAKDTDEAIALAGLHTPAVIVLDVRMPGGGGARAAREIAPLSPGTRFLAFSAYADAGVIAEMRDIGVTDYLLKGVTNVELVDAVRRLAGA
ncbi:DNA-binding NarL/FixJ family response regulator [Kibdelosporangium banguiense]|uniref:DNA-binding NarL/FixJ family response regulator n=1 Tax=Kibdelosporangium banguiense TaxID=1365924 RepID=A0ABS4TL98_9PSEU|nr:response regulator transcription factor [Kibdelosporangium banguiense]MBP2325182.1 DNA-binding NarL/FixJ family response regulator [Kibdelosporangium banguiense]